MLRCRKMRSQSVAARERELSWLIVAEDRPGRPNTERYAAKSLNIVAPLASP